jgi:hypothetical protein
MLTVPVATQEPTEVETTTPMATTPAATKSRGPNKVGRTALWEYLRDNPSLTASKLAEHFESSMQVIYTHISRLRKDGLVSFIKANGENLYTVVGTTGPVIGRAGRPKGTTNKKAPKPKTRGRTKAKAHTTTKKNLMLADLTTGETYFFLDGKWYSTTLLSGAPSLISR